MINEIIVSVASAAILSLLSCAIIAFWASRSEKAKDCKLPEESLSEEQIREIHSRGMITPAEKVKEWESFDLCAPGDAIGSTANRCKKFKHHCHECLIDYASEKDEYHPLELSVCNIYDDKQNNYKSPVKYYKNLYLTGL